MGVGSEVYAAVRQGRAEGIGAELKPSYYRQAVKNLASIDTATDQGELWNAVAETEAEAGLAEESLICAEEGEQADANGNVPMPSEGDIPNPPKRRTRRNLSV